MSKKDLLIIFLFIILALFISWKKNYLPKEKINNQYSNIKEHILSIKQKILGKKV